MDVFSKSRITGWAVVLLVLLNLALLTTIWINKPGENAPPVPRLKGPDQERGIVQNRAWNSEQGQPRRLAEFLIRELRFTRDQMEQFRALREQQHLKVEALNKKTMDLRKELMNELLTEKPDRDNARKLSQTIGETFQEIEQVTFDHFLDLVNLCTPEQKPRFNRLLHEILEMMKPPEHRGRPPVEGQRPGPNHSPFGSQLPPPDGPPPVRQEV